MNLTQFYDPIHESLSSSVNRANFRTQFDRLSPSSSSSSSVYDNNHTDTRMSIQMDQLPVELHIDILSRLPIKNLLRCRCVCKSWLSLTRDPRFTQSHLARSSSLTVPSLILNATGDSNGGSIYLAEHNQTQDDYTCTSVNFSAPPDFKEFRVVGSCNGLLCLVHHKYRFMICVCNPFTGEYVNLPDRSGSSQRHHEMVIGFGFSSKTNEYKVVVIIPIWKGFQLSGCSEVFCYTMGDESWREMEDLPCVIMRRYASTASVNGALHWMCAFPVDLIVSFDVADEVFGVIPHPEFGNGYEESCCSLRELNGCLSIMDSSFYDRVEIWVMEDYGVEESWTKYSSINFSQVERNIRFCQTVCLGRDGNLLLLYKNQDLLLYDPQTVKMRKLCVGGLPSCFEAITHVGSLVSLSDNLRRDRQR